MSLWHHRALIRLGCRSLSLRLVEGYYHVKFRIRKSRAAGNPIAVYQMGKVGSSSLLATVEELLPNRLVLHIHNTTDEGLETTLQRSNVRGRAYPGPMFYAGQYFKKEIASPLGERWNLISLTRDPVARNFSGFFQSLNLWAPDALEQYARSRRTGVFESLLATFLNDYPHSRSSQWFDDELSPSVGVDILNQRFDVSAGYSIYRDWKADLLLIRMENLSACYRNALSEFFQTDTSSLPLINRNEGSGKRYRDLYRDFMYWIRLPPSYLREMYSSRYARHFYSPSELESFRRRWSKEES